MLPAIPQAVDCGDQTETITANSIRAMSRVKLLSAKIKAHRFRAFSDIPIFLRKHCDLTTADAGDNEDAAVSQKPSNSQNEMANQSCSCSSDLGSLRAQPPDNYTASSTSSTSSTPPDIHSMPQYSIPNGFPYSSEYSSKVCLCAALDTSYIFDNFPTPNPLRPQNSSDSINETRPTPTPIRARPSPTQSQPQSRNDDNELPRTMPSFACCLMQSSYALLMLFYKARVARQLRLVPPDSRCGCGCQGTGTGTGTGAADAHEPEDWFAEELRRGLESLVRALSNYSIAFEALDGMRGEFCLFVSFPYCFCFF